MEERRLRVNRTYHNDAGRGIVRLGPEIFSDLEISVGDAVEIEAETTTAGKAWRADRMDWDADTVRIDGYTRHNANANLDEMARVRPAEMRGVDSLVLAPPEDSTLRVGDSHLIRRQLINVPLVKGDVVPVSDSPNHSESESATTSIPLSVVETRPVGVVTATDASKIEIRPRPASRNDQSVPPHEPWV